MRLLLMVTAFTALISFSSFAMVPNCEIKVTDGVGNNKLSLIKMNKVKDHNILGFNTHARTYQAIMSKNFDYNIFLTVSLPQSTYYSINNIVPKKEVSIKIEHENSYQNFLILSSNSSLRAFLPSDLFVHNFVSIKVDCKDID